MNKNTEVVLRILAGDIKPDALGLEDYEALGIDPNAIVERGPLEPEYILELAREILQEDVKTIESLKARVGVLEARLDNVVKVLWKLVSKGDQARRNLEFDKKLKENNRS